MTYRLIVAATRSEGEQFVLDMGLIPLMCRIATTKDQMRGDLVDKVVFLDRWDRLMSEHEKVECRMTARVIQRVNA